MTRDGPRTAPAPVDPSIDALLAGLRRRQRLTRSLHWAAAGLLAGAAIACALPISLALASRPWTVGGLSAVMAGPALAGAAMGGLLGFLRPVDDLGLARALDRAAGADDRFASALQLSRHHRRDRVRLVVEDAIAHVRGTAPRAAIPLRVPRSARWLPLPLVVAALMLALLPQPRLQARPAGEPEIGAEEWGAIRDGFAEELKNLPKPLTPEEEQLRKELEELARLLGQNPDKKDALKEIARLADRVETQRKAAGDRRTSLRAAARSVSSSEALKAFADALKSGDYDQAAAEMDRTSEGLKNAEATPDATEFEAMASDLARLAEQDAMDPELTEATRNAAQAAAKMNREQLADAMKRLAEQLRKDAGKLRKRDGLSRSKGALERLKRRMNQGREGDGDGEGRDGRNGRGGGKGGTKPGWGSRAKWDGGTLQKRDETRDPDLADTDEGSGATHTLKTISPDERALGGKDYAELYAEFQHRAEAELDLESVPLASREYLRRYFNAIRPKDAPPAQKPDADRP